MTISTTITLHGHSFSATIHESGEKWCGGPRVTIDRDGHHCGTGRWDDGIRDCDAALIQDDPDATEEVYTALDDNLREHSADTECQRDC